MVLKSNIDNVSDSHIRLYCMCYGFFWIKISETNLCCTAVIRNRISFVQHHRRHSIVRLSNITAIRLLFFSLSSFFFIFINQNDKQKSHQSQMISFACNVICRRCCCCCCLCFDCFVITTSCRTQLQNQLNIFGANFLYNVI